MKKNRLGFVTHYGFGWGTKGSARRWRKKYNSSGHKVRGYRLSKSESYVGEKQIKDLGGVAESGLMR